MFNSYYLVMILPYRKLSTYNIFINSALIVVYCIICFLTPFTDSYAQKQPLFSLEILENPIENQKQLDAILPVEQIRVYKKPMISNQMVVLTNGYAIAEIQNPDAWKALKNKVKPVGISIVFTKFPADKNDWITNYYILLAKRLKALFALDEKLNDISINWKLMWQTGCRTEQKAESMFHGFVIEYVWLKQKEMTTNRIEIEEDNSGFASNSQTDSIHDGKPDLTNQQQHYLHQAEIFLDEVGGLRDSTVICVFSRNRQWKKSLVVIDWTASMYPYGLQALIWNILYLKANKVTGFVLFNDGNRKPTIEKRIGETGGIYFGEANDLEELIELFRKVRENGGGGEAPENDMEALLKAVKYFPDFDNLILIADNNSCMRDYRLIDSLKTPVKVVLCGYYDSEGVNSQYIDLAIKTKGSLHTCENDIALFAINERNKITGVTKNNSQKVLKISTKNCDAELFTETEEENIRKLKPMKFAFRMVHLSKATRYTSVPENIKSRKVHILKLMHTNHTQIPNKVFQMNKLRTLLLSYNQMIRISPEIKNLKLLQYLGLDRNQLITLPEEITELKHLEILTLGYNNLYSLPSGIGNLQRLKELHLQNNNLSTLPKEIIELQDLRLLDLRGNPLSFENIRYLEEKLPSRTKILF